jgi:hypothetical protein
MKNTSRIELKEEDIIKAIEDYLYKVYEMKTESVKIVDVRDNDSLTMFIEVEYL